MAATGTPTPNIGLRIPLGTDPASVDDINYNSNLIDTKLGAVGNDSVQDQLNDLNSKITPLAPDNSKTQINFNAQTTHTIDIGITPTSDKQASVLLMVANQGILSEISCTGSGAVKTDFGTALSSVSLSGSTLTINFASRPWGLCVALIHHN